MRYPAECAGPFWDPDVPGGSFVNVRDDDAAAELEELEELEDELAHSDGLELAPPPDGVNPWLPEEL